MRYSLILFLFLLPLSASAKTWLVGPARQYKVPSAVAPLVSDGDTVLIDSGLYVGDVATWSKNNLVLRCPDGMARFDADGKIADTKGIWVIYGNNTYVEGFEFYGAAISFNDGNNGAGIRVQGNNFTCRRCYFHQNQEGVLTGNDTTNNNIFIESCVFDSNGVEGTENGGWQHNIYIGYASKCTIKYCYFHHSMVGHELKCRANRSYVLYNYIVDGPDGDGSYSIDIPQGGLAIVMGNIIEKGPETENSTVVSYGEEGFRNPDTDFYFINNTIVTDRVPTTLFNIASGTRTALIANNIFAGPAHPLTGIPDTASNVFSTDTSFFHFADPTHYDYHITAPFPGLGNAANLGSVDGFSLTPTSEYVDPGDSAPRTSGNDVGAFALAVNGVLPNNQLHPADISAYPNPVGGETRIPVPDDLTRIKLVLYNATGDFIEQESMNVSAGTILFTRHNLPPGVYYYRIRSEGGESECSGSVVLAPR